MSKKSLARLSRIVTGTFGTARDELLSFDTNLSRFEKFVHFWALVWLSFERNRCFVRASALSYTTMLALIPMLFVVMSMTNLVLKSEGEERIAQFIQSFVDKVVPELDAAQNQLPNFLPVGPPLTNEFATVPLVATNVVVTLTDTNPPAATGNSQVLTRENVSQKVAAQIHQFVKNTSTGAVGTLGMLGLLLTAIMTLTRVEETFNDIWGVSRGRNWLARVIQYWAAITLGPVLLLSALGLASGPRFQKTRELISIFPYLDLVVSTLLPVLVLCLTFALLYKLMPNTKVDFSAAFMGGAIAGVAWHAYSHLGFLLASGFMNASRIYGSIALVLLFMGGLYVAWLTVLFGAQVAYAFQNRSAYLQEKLAENVNQRGREFVALRLMTCIGQRFHRGLPPVTLREISTELGVPGKLAQQVLQTLLAAHLVVEVAGLENGYAPARPLEAINTHDILLAMRAAQGQELETRDEPVRAEVLGEFARIQAAEREAAERVTMLALVNRAQARVDLALLTAPSAHVAPAPSSKLAAVLDDEPAATVPIEMVPSASFATGTPTTQVQQPGTSKSRSVASVGSAAPTAPSNQNENESFPL